MRVFNRSNRLFLLEADNEQMFLAPRKLIDDVPEKFTKDITFKAALQAGDIEIVGGSGAVTEVDQIMAEKTPVKENPVQHPDSIEETEAKRRAAVATGRVHKTKKD